MKKTITFEQLQKLVKESEIDEARSIPVPDDFDPDDVLEVLYKIFKRANFLGLAPFAYHSGPKWCGWRFDDGENPPLRAVYKREALMSDVKKWIIKHGMNGIIRIGGDNWLVWPNDRSIPSGNRIRADAKKHNDNDPMITAKVKIPYKGLQIEDNAVVDYVGTEAHVVIPDGVVKISPFVFSNNKTLKTIDLPESLEEIYSWAFDGCTALKEIRIPNNVNYIGNNAFNGCSSLEMVNIPKSLDHYMTDDVFNGCSSLKMVTIPDEVKSSMVEIGGPIGDALYNEGKTVLYYGPKDATGSFEVPSTVKEIKKYAFANCAKLTSITLPDGLQEIGGGAFEGCTGLTEVNVPDSVTEMSGGVFRGCTGLTSFTIPKGLTEVPSGLFLNCTNLTSVNIHDGVTEIRAGAFEKCVNLKSIKLPRRLEEISWGAFDGSGIESIDLPPTMKNIYSRAFSNCPLTSIVIPDGVTEIESLTFRYSKLESVTIGSGVKTIGYDAFANCSELTSIVIPNNVTEINSDAFVNCTKLSKVKLPSSLFETIIKNPDKYFANTPWAEKVKNGGLSFDVDDKGTLDKYDGHDTVITIPDEVHVIGAGAFFGNDRITKVTIPDTVTVIEPGAFENCEALETIVLGVGVKKIEKDTFKNVSDNITIYVPNFDMCKLLLDSGLPDSATVIIGKGSSRRRLSWDPEK